MIAEPPIEVRGGIGGTAVGLDELAGAAGRLAQSATELGEVVLRLATTTAVTGASAPLSPVTAVRAEAELVGATRAMARETAAVAAVAVAVRAAAWAYREVEEDVVRTTGLVQDAVMVAVGRAAPTLVVGVVALDAMGVEVGALLDRVVWQVPEVAELAGGSSGLVVGLRTNPVTAPFVVPARWVRRGAHGEAPTGRADPDEAAIGILADSAAVWGLLSDDGSVQVTAVQVTAVEGGQGPRSGSGYDADRGSARAPAGLADLARDQAALPGDGRVRVVEVSGEHGPAWIVQIGGTQVWNPRAGENPFDLTSDVRSMAAESTLLAAGVQQALAAAQSRAASSSTGREVAAEPVLLSGHSLGGIVAAGLASSTQFRAAHRVTHVVTLGSPVGRVPVPAEVRVLSVEHHQDPVPRLEGRPNPDRAGWVTVSRDLEASLARDPDAVPGTNPAADPRASEVTPQDPPRASAAHRSERYVETAALVDASDDRSVTAWRAGAGAFFAGPEAASAVVVRDYRIARVEVPP